MVNSYVADVENFYLGGANNAATQAGAAVLVAGIKMFTGVATAGDQLADQVGLFGGQASAGEFHKENIPVVGSVGTRIGTTTAALVDDPRSAENWADAIGAYSEGALLTAGAVETYRSVGGPGAYKAPQSTGAPEVSAPQTANAKAQVTTEGGSTGGRTSRSRAARCPSRHSGCCCSRVARLQFQCGPWCALGRACQPVRYSTQSYERRSKAARWRNLWS